MKGMLQILMRKFISNCVTIKAPPIKGKILVNRRGRFKDDFVIGADTKSHFVSTTTNIKEFVNVRRKISVSTKL